MPAVVGVFPCRQETETAIDSLVALGVDKDSIGVVWREKSVPKQEEVEVIVYVDHFEDPGTEAKKGAVGGAIGGGAAGVGSVLLASAGGVVLATPIGALLAVGAGDVFMKGQTSLPLTGFPFVQPVMASLK